MMKRHLMNWLIGVVAVIITVLIMRLLPDKYRLVWSPEWWIAVFVPVLALANAIIGGILRMLAMPITCLTLGLFSFVINAIVFWIAAYLTHGQSGAGQPIGFLTALIGSVLYTLISAPLSSLVKERR